MLRPRSHKSKERFWDRRQTRHEPQFGLSNFFTRDLTTGQRCLSIERCDWHAACLPARAAFAAVIVLLTWEGASMDSQPEQADSNSERARRRDTIYRANGYKAERRYRKRKSPTTVAGMQNRRNKHWLW
jgi:hypothetical protein